jgi:hypothetical protein
VVELLIIIIYTFTPLLKVFSLDLILAGNEHKNTSVFGSSREFGTGEGCLIYLRVTRGRGVPRRNSRLHAFAAGLLAVPYNDRTFVKSYIVHTLLNKILADVT